MRRLLAALCAISVLTGPAAAAELEYAYPDQSVWTTRTDAKGEPENPLLRLAAALFAEAGIPWHGKSYPAARMFEYLQGGQAQFSMLVAAPALKECCLFSREPVTSTEIRVYRAAHTPPVRSREDLAGKKVIVIRGYSYGGLLGFLNDPANRVAAVTAAKHDQAFDMLERGRGDYLVDYAGPGGEIVAQRPRAGIRHDTLSRQDVYLVLGKSWPDADQVMARLESIAARLDVARILAGGGPR